MKQTLVIVLRRSILVGMVGAVGLFGLGCKTVPADSLASFSAGLSAAQAQSQEAFQSVNELIADASLDFAASQPTLKEENFTAGLDEESLALWAAAFTKLGQYAQHIQALISPDLTKDFDEQAVQLGKGLQDFGQTLAKNGFVKQAPEVTPGLAAGFTELGSLVIRITAQSKAHHVLIRTDKQARQLFVAMADAVGASHATALRGTSWANWNQRLAEKKLEFLSQPDIRAKRKVAAAFLDLVERRGAQDLVLASLRRSLLALADLHHSLAEGQDYGAQMAVATIKDEIAHSRDLQKRFKEALNTDSKP